MRRTALQMPGPGDMWCASDLEAGDWLRCGCGIMLHVEDEGPCTECGRDMPADDWPGTVRCDEDDPDFAL
jgi:hypothetical protein